MSFFGVHFVGDSTFEEMKAALAAAGHQVAQVALSEPDKLVAAAKAKFPELVTGVQKLITDAASKDATGAEKLFAVADDTVKLLPAALAAIPEAKSFAIAFVQSVYNDGLGALETAAKDVLGAIGLHL